jgi:hypothetical protein
MPDPLHCFFGQEDWPGTFDCNPDRSFWETKSDDNQGIEDMRNVTIGF